MPHRYLKHWFLVEPETPPPPPPVDKGNDDGDDSSSSDSNDEENKDPVVVSKNHSCRNNFDTRQFQYGKRMPLPEETLGKFSKNTILYGWLHPSPTHQHQQSSSSSSSATTTSNKNEWILLKLVPDRWVLNRSKQHRGYWIRTNRAAYWLQEPCSYRPKEVAEVASASSSSSSSNPHSNKNNGTTKQKKKKKKKRRRRLFHCSTVHNRQQSTIQPTTPPAPKAPAAVPIKLYPSQEQILLQQRLRLALLSVIVDAIANMTDEDVEGISRLDPPAFLALLMRERPPQQSAGRDRSGDDEASAAALSPPLLSDWSTAKSHGCFIGSHLILLRPALTVRCPLLAGFLRANAPRGSENCPGAEATTIGPNDGHNSITTAAKEDDVYSICVEAESWTCQTAWGEPTASSNGTAFGGNDNANTSTTTMKPPRKRILGVKRISSDDDGEDHNQPVVSTTMDELAMIGPPSSTPARIDGNNSNSNGLLSQRCNDRYRHVPTTTTMTPGDNISNSMKTGILKITTEENTTAARRKKRKSVRWADFKDPDTALDTDHNQEEFNQNETPTQLSQQQAAQGTDQDPHHCIDIPPHHQADLDLELISS